MSPNPTADSTPIRRVVLLEPKTIQHGRRIALRATAAGILEQEVLE